MVLGRFAAAFSRSGRQAVTKAATTIVSNNAASSTTKPRSFHLGNIFSRNKPATSSTGTSGAATELQPQSGGFISRRLRGNSPAATSASISNAKRAGGYLGNIFASSKGSAGNGASNSAGSSATTSGSATTSRSRLNRRHQRNGATSGGGGSNQPPTQIVRVEAGNSGPKHTLIYRIVRDSAIIGLVILAIIKLVNAYSEAKAYLRKEKKRREKMRKLFLNENKLGNRAENPIDVNFFQRRANVVAYCWLPDSLLGGGSQNAQLDGGGSGGNLALVAGGANPIPTFSLPSAVSLQPLEDRPAALGGAASSGGSTAGGSSSSSSSGSSSNQNNSIAAKSTSGEQKSSSFFPKSITSAFYSITGTKKSSDSDSESEASDEEDASSSTTASSTPNNNAAAASTSSSTASATSSASDVSGNDSTLQPIDLLELFQGKENMGAVDLSLHVENQFVDPNGGAVAQNSSQNKSSEVQLVLCSGSHHSRFLSPDGTHVLSLAEHPASSADEAAGAESKNGSSSSSSNECICDVCYHTVPVGKTTLRCRHSDFDVCESCAKKTATNGYEKVYATLAGIKLQTFKNLGKKKKPSTEQENAAGAGAVSAATNQAETSTTSKEDAQDQALEYFSMPKEVAKQAQELKQQVAQQEEKENLKKASASSSSTQQSTTPNPDDNTPDNDEDPNKNKQHPVIEELTNRVQNLKEKVANFFALLGDSNSWNSALLNTLDLGSDDASSFFDTASDSFSNFDDDDDDPASSFNRALFEEQQSRSLSMPKQFKVQRNVKTKFKDVIGQEIALEKMKEFVDILQHPDKYAQIGSKVPKGGLLLGPPGCGKTLLASAVAGECGLPFISAQASEFVQVYVGMGAKNIQSLFALARKEAEQSGGCILFIDEIDSIGRDRSKSLTNGDGETGNTLNQLLTEMDGFHSKGENIVVLAATNRANTLDSALMRPGRLDRKIPLQTPNVSEREELFAFYLKKFAWRGADLREALETSLDEMTGATKKVAVSAAGGTGELQETTSSAVVDQTPAKSAVLDKASDEMKNLLSNYATQLAGEYPDLAEQARGTSGTTLARTSGENNIATATAPSSSPQGPISTTKNGKPIAVGQQVSLALPNMRQSFFKHNLQDLVGVVVGKKTELQVVKLNEQEMSAYTQYVKKSGAENQNHAAPVGEVHPVLEAKEVDAAVTGVSASATASANSAPAAPTTKPAVSSGSMISEKDELHKQEPQTLAVASPSAAAPSANVKTSPPPPTFTVMNTTTKTAGDGSTTGTTTVVNSSLVTDSLANVPLNLKLQDRLIVQIGSKYYIADASDVAPIEENMVKKVAQKAARLTTGFTGATISSVCNEAGILSVRESLVKKEDFSGAATSGKNKNGAATTDQEKSVGATVTSARAGTSTSSSSSTSRYQGVEQNTKSLNKRKADSTLSGDTILPPSGTEQIQTATSAVDHALSATETAASSPPKNIKQPRCNNRKRLPTITEQKLRKAMDMVAVGNGKRNYRITEKEKEATAFHEAGHTAMSFYLEKSPDPVKVTVLPTDTGALGHMMPGEPKSETSSSKAELEAQICVALGGRVAEELFTDEIGTGASSDLERVTSIAQDYVYSYGFGEHLLTFHNSQQNTWSEQTKQQLEQEVKDLVKTCYGRTKDMLKKHDFEIRSLVKELIEAETLYSEDIRRILAVKK
ncbi:unnamed protein product [Amoebophrya sp. A120]|nr:unnamed protein product [Amoebophrya sp. A120]|eukprot:GSA120T00012428001.1